VLSWQAVLEGVADPHDGNNVVFHEFAHHLDDIDEGADGTPPLESREQYRTWNEVVDREYRRLVKASREGEPSLMDYYGATDRAEFFAVATECFFECGAQLREEHAKLYEVLRGFYRQDTATWPRGVPHEAPRRRVGWRRARRARSDDGDSPVDLHSPNAAERGQIERLLETVRIQPGTASAHFSLGVLYLNRRDFRKAVDAFSAAIALEPHDGESWRHRGLGRIGLGEFAAARSDLDKAIELDPSDSDSYRARAESNVELGNLEQALTDCMFALRGNGRDADALHIKGMAQAGLTRYKSALASLNSAINADPNRAEFYADRSRVFEALGDRRRAERDRIEAIRLDPDMAH
jgi:tetratricopeptide (TPR) repeat protein